MKVALFGDLHVDFDYTPGSSNKCGKILCCRSDSGIPRTKEEEAGPWGDYKCDLPEWTFLSMLDYIKDEVSPAMVFWSGDSISHNLDSLSKNEVVTNKNLVIDRVMSKFKDIPVYFTLGNHDMYPLNKYADGVDTSEEVVSQYNFRVPGDQQDTFNKFGYYSAPIKASNGQTAKLISFNSNFCYKHNYA